MKAVEPKSLQEAIIYFSDPDVCREYVVSKRWPDGVTCPNCGSSEVRFLRTRGIWECKSKHPKRQFSCKVGTIFEDSAIGLDKWLCAMWMVGSCRNGVSSYEIKRHLGVTQKTAWFLLHRIRKAMQADSGAPLSGEVEADETFIGGNMKNMHKHSKRKIKAANDGQWGKTVVLGLLQRNGEARAMVAPSRTKRQIDPRVRANVQPGSTLYTDEHGAYMDMNDEYAHHVIEHLSACVEGRVHTNGMENFWSLLKRTLGGTYVSVDPHHLFRYLDEQCFRFNKRHLTDGERLAVITTQVVNRRQTYEELTSCQEQTNS